MLITEKEAKRVCETALKCITADDAEVTVTTEDYSHLRFAANSFATSGRREQASATVTVWINKRRGSASSADLQESSIKRAVAEAEDLARLAPVDKEYLPTLAAQKYLPSNAGYVETTVN